MLNYIGKNQPLYWQGSPREMAFTMEAIQEALQNTAAPCYVVKDFRGRIGVSNGGQLVSEGRGLEVLACVQGMTAAQLGDDW